MNWMMKNSAGEPCAMLTLTVCSWVVATLLIALSLFSGDVKIEPWVDLKMKAVDPTLYAAYLGATFTSYVIRRNKKDTIAADGSTTTIEEEDVEIERNG